MLLLAHTKFSIYLVLIYANCSNASFNSFHHKNENLLNAVKIITSKTTSNKVLNVIIASSKTDSQEFSDLFLKATMEKFKVRIHTVEMIRNPQIASPRKNSVIILETFQDFKKVLQNLIHKSFHKHGHYIFTLVSGNIQELSQIFYECWKNQFYNVIAIYEDLVEHIQVFSFFPYRSATDCSNTSPVLVNTYIDGSFIYSLKDIFPKKMYNLNQCAVRVGSPSSWPPHMNTEILPNGTIKGYGRDHEIMVALAQNLNFKLNYSHIGILGAIHPNGTMNGIPESVMKNQSDMIVGDWWLILYRLQFFDATNSYISEQLVFVLKFGSELSSFEKLRYPFSLAVWITSICFILCGFTIIFITQRQKISVQNFIFGRNVKYPYLNMIIGVLGQNQFRLPTRNFARFILMNFLLLCLVLRTVYQGKMFELMKLNMKHSEPNSMDDAVEKDYELFCFETTCAISGLQNFHKRQVW